MHNFISASVMCVNDLLDLRHSIEELQCVGVDMLHLDAMDGHFVNNITFGPDILNAIHQMTFLPCDYHLMLDNPLPFIKRLDLRKNDIVTIHAEIPFDNFFNAFEYLKEHNINIGIALNPKTSFECIIPYLDKIKMILVMLINPGFAGQSIVNGILTKPIVIREYLDTHDYNDILVSIDGGVSVERAKLLANDGINVFVGGTSGLFVKNKPLEKSVALLRDAITLSV